MFKHLSSQGGGRMSINQSQFNLPDLIPVVLNNMISQC